MSKNIFRPHAKAHAIEMVHNLDALRSSDITTLTWMSPRTEKRPHREAGRLHARSAIPTSGATTPALTIDRDVVRRQRRRAACVWKSTASSQDRQAGRPNEWGMTPPTVNAYYNPPMNEIVFPAGILQPPFFDPKADDAFNYGGIGAVIGHEMTHGFDDQGAQFDAQGNLRNWWTAEDRKKFESAASLRRQAVRRLRRRAGPAPQRQARRRRDIADLGGAEHRLRAYEKSLEGKPRPDHRRLHPRAALLPRLRPGLGPPISAPSHAPAGTDTNPHPLSRFRANGPLSDSAAFAQAFGCKKGDRMVREQACKIW